MPRSPVLVLPVPPQVPLDVRLGDCLLHLSVGQLHRRHRCACTVALRLVPPARSQHLTVVDVLLGSVDGPVPDVNVTV